MIDLSITIPTLQTINNRCSIYYDDRVGRPRCHRSKLDSSRYHPRPRGSRSGTPGAALLTGNDSVLDIALASGFESHEGFTRAFRRRFGMTPSAYRSRGSQSPTTPDQAREHRRLIAAVGPCVGLLRMREDGGVCAAADHGRPGRLRRIRVICLSICAFGVYQSLR